MCLSQNREMTNNATNYDVLLEHGDSFKLYNDEHVGNKRFEILLNLHRQHYQQAKSDGKEEEMEIVVRKIIDIVCRKCIPNGRFLERVREEDENEETRDGPEWIDLGEGVLAATRIHEALGTSFESRSSKIFSSVTQPSDTSGGTKKSGPVVDMKRRRRGSYARLRRSISESMLFKPDAIDKVSRKSDSDEAKEVHEPKPMDVVFQANRKHLAMADNHAGNARFDVLVTIQSGTFATTDQESCKRVCNDIICTVEHEWKGRFLVQSLLGCVVLSPDETKTTVSNYLIQSQKREEAQSCLKKQLDLEKNSVLSQSISLPVKRSFLVTEENSREETTIPIAFHESFRKDTAFDWGKFNQVEDSLNSFTIDSMEFDSSGGTSLDPFSSSSAPARSTSDLSNFSRSSMPARSASFLSNPSLPPTLESDGEAKGLRTKAVDFLLKFKKKRDLNKRLGSRFARK